MALLTNDEKAAKRKAVAMRRLTNTAVGEYSHIVYKQCRNVASQSGVPYEVLEGIGFEALAKALQKGSPSRPGFMRYVKLYVKGYLLNYLRDGSRPVRLPRALTLAYLKEQKALREDPEFRLLSDEERAEALCIDLDLLLESRTSIAIEAKDLDLHDRASEAVVVSGETQVAADLVQEVIDAGCKAVARLAKSDEATVKSEFYKALHAVLEQANDN